MIKDKIKEFKNDPKKFNFFKNGNKRKCAK